MLYLGSDHAGYIVKEAIKDYFNQQNIPYTDIGCYSLKSANYAEIAINLATKVSSDIDSRGILICGSGVGVSIAANKVKGILAGLVDKKELASLAVSHDHINVLCLSGRFVSINDNLEIVKTFLSTQQLHDYHEKRIESIKNYEKENTK